MTALNVENRVSFDVTEERACSSSPRTCSVAKESLQQEKMGKRKKKGDGPPALPIFHVKKQRLAQETGLTALVALHKYAHKLDSESMSRE